MPHISGTQKIRRFRALRTSHHRGYCGGTRIQITIDILENLQANHRPESVGISAYGAGEEEMRCCKINTKKRRMQETVEKIDSPTYW